MALRLWQTPDPAVTPRQPGEVEALGEQDHLYVVEDVARNLRFGLVRETGGLVRSAWGEEAFHIVPFLQIDEEVVIGAGDPFSYLFTPERVALDRAGTNTDTEVEITLVARGVAGLHRAGGRRVPWEFQVTYNYDATSGLLTLFARPQIHPPNTVATFGLRVQWSQSWVETGRRWVRSPQGAVVGFPEQEGESPVATETTLTMFARTKGSAGLVLLVQFPAQASERPVLAELIQMMKISTSAPAVAGNGLPVLTDWQQVDHLLRVELPACSGYSPACRTEYAPSIAPAPLPAGQQGEQEQGRGRQPGRYRLVWELVPEDPARVTLRLALPFRFWPQALHSPAQAEFAQLLLTCRLESDFLVAYNFVHPRRFYLGTERDDVLAETGRLAVLLYRQLGDEDLRHLAWKMAEQLLAHQQPDGGFTFGVSVNGFRADYSDTDADAVQFFLALTEDPGLDPLRRQVYLEAARRAAAFICSYQDPEGFFWGRVERPDRHRFGHQPWFTSYSVVACLEVAAREQGSELASRLQDAARRGLAWLCSVQADDGHFRFDTQGPYADYDDLSNTSVAVWALGRAAQLLPADADRPRWLAAAARGMAYLLSLENPEHPGEFLGRQLNTYEKLVYDYRLGAAFATYLQVAEEVEGAEPARREVEAAFGRYLQHIRQIQGYGTITGGWGSVFLAGPQEFAAVHDWYETGSAWQEYVFLGWQGKVVELLAGR
ncbi:MAG: terpene cyclase/mutase family protein [Limnochordales bacterium]|nr:terpene cyclase/mutase family protein [Limnochordales bacterium]